MLRVKTGMMYTLQKGALFGVAPSTCIRPKKDSWATRVKLIPDWSSSVRKTLQPMLDVLSWNTKLFFSVGTNSVVSGIQDK